MKTILMILLGARGDCVYGTTLAHQIKKDNPDCHLIWAISPACSDILRNNPHVDEVWEISGNCHSEAAAQYPLVFHEASILASRGVLDRVYAAQLNPDNMQNYDGTIRPSIFRAYGKPMTVPIESHVVLTQEEKDAVRLFAEQHALHRYTHCILFECTGKSQQSNMTVEHALHAAQQVLQQLPDTCFLISTDQPIISPHPSIIAADTISYRENLALTQFCTHFIGCGSGITALITCCPEAKPLPAIQVLSGATSVYASFAHDFAHWGLDVSRFIEMRDNTPDMTAESILVLCTQGLEAARQRFHQEPVVNFKHYLGLVTPCLLSRHRIADAACSLTHVVNRYGWHKELLDLGQHIIEEHQKQQDILHYATDGSMRDFLKKFSKAMFSFAQ